MDKLELMRLWLETFYGWRDAQWGLDLTGCTPVSCHLTMEDDRILRRTEDVTGASVQAMQVLYTLVRVSYGEENPGEWVENFTNWVTEQSQLGLVPEFGDRITRIRTEKGKLEIQGDKTVYTVRLLGTYERIFEVINDV